MVSPSTYATRIQTYVQSCGTACFDQNSDEKPKVEMKTKSNCAPDGSVMLENGFSEWNCNNNRYLHCGVFEIFGNYFHLFIGFFVYNDVMFYTAVWEFEILCE